MHTIFMTILFRLQLHICLLKIDIYVRKLKDHNQQFEKINSIQKTEVLDKHKQISKFERISMTKTKIQAISQHTEIRKNYLPIGNI